MLPSKSLSFVYINDSLLCAKCFGGGVEWNSCLIVSFNALYYYITFQGDFKQALFPTVSAGQMPGILSEEEGDVTIPDIQFQEGELEQLDEEFDLEMTANESALEYAGKPNPDDSEIKVHTMSDYTTGLSCSGWLD